jgi:spermidine/putrescine transport system ATP-binding protein
MRTEENILELTGIMKSFDGNEALRGIDLTVKKGEFLTLLGPSGCGKTTTLRIVAGLEMPDSGRVLLQGQDVTGWEPNRRNVNTVFQNYALFPHMNVYQNVAYGLKLRHTPKEEIRRRVGEMLELVQLPGYEKRMPTQLSGGQRQRVAIARALVNSPAVLLLDEPLGALDLQLRRQMQVELKRLQQKLGITFVYITHDQEEALNMSDRIGVMNDGVLEQLGAPDEVYEHPASRFVAGFIGQSNLFDAKVTGADGQGNLFLLCGSDTVRASGTAQSGERVTVSLRPERVHYTEHEDKTFGFSVRGVVKEHRYTGGVLRTTLALPGGRELTAGGMTDWNRSDRIPVGSEVFIQWDPRCAVVVERGAAGDEAEA